MKKYVFILMSCFLSFLSFGQNDTISSDVIATAGGDTTVNGVSVSWTLGEVAIETIANDDSTLILTQGFQQGYFEITSIGEPLSNNFLLKVYPNPASEFVWVALESEEIKDAIVELYDMEGKLVYNSKLNVVEGPNKIELNRLSSSQYILRISDATGNVLQTFKLIKR
ncbi:MAG: T9SS type A sorting domain-containing protein [Bacteroidales bacterium]|nr:T9SS type A sorting domain-containing protein [Bacteroidales bacterium]